MFRFDVCAAIAPPAAAGTRAAELMRMFGITRARLRKHQARLHLKLEVGPGQILFITGPSGAGKSVLLRALYEQVSPEERLRLEDVALEEGKSAIDCVGHEHSNLQVCLEAMNRAGLSDVFCMLRSPAQLSIGQQARYRLAKTLVSGRRLIFADEFTASMDRITALAAAYHLRKAATRSGKSFIIASCHDDILDELRPDTIIRL